MVDDFSHVLLNQSYICNITFSVAVYVADHYIALCRNSVSRGTERSVALNNSRADRSAVAERYLDLVGEGVAGVDGNRSVIGRFATDGHGKNAVVELISGLRLISVK